MSSTSPRPLDHDDRTGHLGPDAGRAARLRARLPHPPLVLVPRLRSRAPRVPFVALVSVLMVAGVVGLLLFNTSMQQASFEATRLESQAASLSAQEQSLTMQLDKLRDPQQLAQRAQAQGLVPPSTVAFLDVETGKVTGDPTPAQAGTGLRLQAPPPARPADLDPPAATTSSDPQTDPQTGPQQDGRGRGDQQGQRGQQGQQGQQGQRGGGEGAGPARQDIDPRDNPLAPQRDTQARPGQVGTGRGAATR